jgi:signal transduction histidine kinase
MEAGTVQRTITSQQVKELITDVATLLQPLADEKRVTISVSAPDNLRRVEADREELIRLFTNLVSNAIKYNKDGGRLAVEATEEGPYVKVTVRDSGIGISPEGVERLFSEFFREKRPETAYVTGTGLGLSIVKQIIEAHGGTIDVQSQVDVGTTFSFVLKAAPAE